MSRSEAPLRPDPAMSGARLSAAALLALLGVAAPAHAQDAGFDGHGFKPAAFDGDPRDPLVVQRPGRIYAGEWFATGLFEYAESPLVFIYDSPTGPQTLPIVDDLIALNLSGGAAVHERVRLDVSMPVFFSSLGRDGAQGAAVGDLRLAAMTLIARPSQYEGEGGVGLGLVPYVDLPTGDAAKFLGNGGLTGGTKLAATYELGRATFGADVGVEFKPTVDLGNVTGSDAVTAGGSLGFLITPRTGITAETTVSLPFDTTDIPWTTSPSEGILTLRHHTKKGIGMLLGGAMALTPGSSAAAWRVFLGGGFGVVHDPIPRDTDGDGIPDKSDACPEQPETVNGLDDTDGCPDQLTRMRIRATYKGDVKAGAILTIRGPEGEVRATSGTDPLEYPTEQKQMWDAVAELGTCLVGGASREAVEGPNDFNVELQRMEGSVRYEVVNEEGVPVPGATVRFAYSEAERECIPTQLNLGTSGTGTHKVGMGRHLLFVEAPEYAIYRAGIEVTDGGDQLVRVVLHPTKVRLEDKQIVILEKVFFELDKAVIRSESFQLLDEMADTILANPQIKTLEVAGHTDAQGPDDYNLNLSDERARAVRTYLINRGVDPARLRAVGYGETRPIGDNANEDGRSMNRRVEFNILATSSVGGSR